MYRGEIEWSPQFKHSKDVKRLWSQLKKYRMQHQTGKHVSLTTIRRLMRQTKLQDSPLATTGEIEEYWIDACKKFKEGHNKAKALNGTHLITLDKAHAVTNGTTEESEKKLRLRIAAQRDIGRAIARVKRKKISLSDKAVSYNS